MLKSGKPIELKNVTEAGTIEGYGSVFDEVDLGFDVVEKGAFSNSLQERGLPKMLWGHEFNSVPIGNWTVAKEDDRGLFLKGELFLDQPRAKDVHSALKNGAVDGLSIGFSIADAEIADSGVRFIKEADLFEVSVVNFPMNESARVDAVKSLIENNQMTKRRLEEILRDSGFSKARAQAIVSRGYAGLVGDESDETKRLQNLVTSFEQNMRIS